MKAALLVIDVQNDFFKLSAETAQSLKDAIEYINEAIQLFRNKNYPVICIQDIEGFEPGEPGFEIPDGLKILPSDIHIQKTYSNAFNKTSLKTELDKLGINTIILTGFAAEYCVLSTYRAAKDLDINPIMMRGALASSTPSNIQFVENISDVMSYGALKAALE